METLVNQFIHETTWDDLPPDVRHQARRCLLDTLAAGIGGRATELSQIIHNFAAAAFGGQGAKLWLDGREVSPPGAALANGMTVDALDIHDGHSLTKGHAGAAVVPGLFAVVFSEDAAGVTGKEFLTALVIGYEIALRAGMALHETACDYHTSGAWNALGVAALAARRFGLNRDRTWHALGIAEYHGPRSQMMRCIDHPAMVKDGSGWGAMTGISAAFLARANFTGAPALTVMTSCRSKGWRSSVAWPTVAGAALSHPGRSSSAIHSGASWRPSSSMPSGIAPPHAVATSAPRVTRIVAKRFIPTPSNSAY